MKQERKGKGNWILDAIPDEEMARIETALEHRVLEPMEVLFGPDQKASWAYFPAGSVISFLRGFRNGSQIEVGIVGREGMAGLHTLLGPGSETSRAVVQSHGAAYRIEVGPLQEEFARAQTLQRLLLRFTHTLIGQISFTAACNQLHTMDQRLARWLLSMSDRMSTPEIPLSHEFLAHMLGTGRARVTAAVGRLRKQGAVDSGRGWIRVEDRRALEREACECYEEMNRLCRSAFETDSAGNEARAPDSAQ